VTDVIPGISHDTLTDALCRTFGADGQSSDLAELLDSDLYKDTFAHLESWTWRFGRTPPFTHTFSTRLEGLGGFEVGLVVEEGSVKDVLVYSDALDVQIVEDLERKLVGVKYERTEVENALKDHVLREWVISNIV
jgi:lipoate-protein ligase A